MHPAAQIALPAQKCLRLRLAPQVVRLARAAKPSALLLENVPNLLRLHGGHMLHCIVDALHDGGYCVRTTIFNTAPLVPQHRERLFLVAIRSDLTHAIRAFRWPTLPASAAPPTLRAALSPMTPSQRARYALSDPQWERVRASREWRRCAGWRLARLDKAARTLRGTYRSSYARFSEFVVEDDTGERATEGRGARAGAACEEGAAECAASDEAGAAEGETGVDVAEVGEVPLAAHGRGTDSILRPRFFTERECLRLQGFPETFELRGAKFYQQVLAFSCAHTVLTCVSVVPALGHARMRTTEDIQATSLPCL